MRNLKDDIFIETIDGVNLYKTKDNLFNVFQLKDDTEKILCIDKSVPIEKCISIIKAK